MLPGFELASSNILCLHRPPAESPFARRMPRSSPCRKSPLSARLDSPALLSQLLQSGVASTSHCNNASTMPATTQEQHHTGTPCSTHPPAHVAMVQWAVTGCKRPLQHDMPKCMCAAAEPASKASKTVPWRRRPASPQKLASIVAGLGLDCDSTRPPKHVTFMKQCLSEDAPAGSSPQLSAEVVIWDPPQDPEEFAVVHSGILVQRDPKRKKSAAFKKAKKVKAARKAVRAQMQAMEEQAQELHWDAGAALALFSMTNPLPPKAEVVG